MKFKLPLICIVVFLIASCGESNSETSVQQESKWVIGSNIYTPQSSKYTPSFILGGAEDIEIPGISISSTKNPEAYQLEDPGSTILIQFTKKGEGVYKIGRAEDLLFSVNDPLKKIITIAVNIKSNDTTITTWAPAPLNSGEVIVTIDNQEKYHFTTNTPLTLEQQFYEFPNTPEPIDLSMTNIFNQN